MITLYTVMSDISSQLARTITEIEPMLAGLVNIYNYSAAPCI